MTSDPAALRRAYAHRMAAGNAAVERAMASVRREEFLGEPPWRVLDIGEGIRRVDDSDLAAIYDDVLVVLDQSRGVNNGSPALHGAMLGALEVHPRDRVLHLGAGTGYYTAILAELTGPGGVVTAVEVDPWLAVAARRNLAPWRNVVVTTGDAAAYPDGDVDRIYVNFAVAFPAPRWLDGLANGGTLIFPLGVPHPDARGSDRRHSAHGAMLRVERQGEAYAVQYLTPVAFICAEGELTGDEAMQRTVYEAFGAGGVERVASLRRDTVPPERCWLATPGFSLCFDPPKRD